MSEQQQRQEAFHQAFENGKLALEKGRYDVSIEQLEKAKTLINPYSKLGGEVRIWLISAYQASNRVQDAIALCQELAKHPSSDIRKQSQNLLYILKAPALKRPEEWLTKIPDLSEISPDQGANHRSRPTGSRKPRQRKQPEPEPIDPSEINRKDNYFIWVAFLLILLLFLVFN